MKKNLRKLNHLNNMKTNTIEHYVALINKEFGNYCYADDDRMLRNHANDEQYFGLNQVLYVRLTMLNHLTFICDTKRIMSYFKNYYLRYTECDMNNGVFCFALNPSFSKNENRRKNMEFVLSETE